MSDDRATRAALDHCARITRREAANFHYGIRLLPPAKRDALCAVYAFARRIDDIGDGGLAAPEKLRRLDDEGAAITQLTDEHRFADPVHLALKHTCARFPVPRDALIDLLDGVRMDVLETRYEEFDDLVVYCRRVAGSIGRLCLGVFGSPDASASELADELGVALQITNILRDVLEDARNGRVYLPLADLQRFGWPGGQGDPAPAIVIAAGAPTQGGTAALEELVHFEAARAREWFSRGSRLLASLDRRSGACVRAMSGIYRRLLEDIDAQPTAILNRRVALSTRAKVIVAAQSLVGRGR